MEYEWRLQHEDLDESDEDLDEKVKDSGGGQYKKAYWCIAGKMGVQGPLSPN